MKYFLYLLLFLSFGAYYACDSKNETDYSIDGQWRIIERKFTCESDADLQRMVQRLVETRNNAFLKGEYEYLSFDDGVYKEGEMKWEKTGGGTTGLPLDSFLYDTYRFRGLYAFDGNNNVDITIQNVGATWQYKLNLADLNNEFINTKQEMGKADLEVFLEKYLGLSSHTVGAAVRAVWETKAVKVKD